MAGSTYSPLVLVTACVVLGSSWSTAEETHAAAGGCDRQCLRSVTDQYMQALVAHDPSRLKWADPAKGKRDFQTQKTRSWPVNTTIGAMVSKMAGEHGMTPATSPELANVQLPHIDQSAESDINLLVRLAKRAYKLEVAG